MSRGFSLRVKGNREAPLKLLIYVHIFANVSLSTLVILPVKIIATSSISCNDQYITVPDLRT